MQDYGAMIRSTFELGSVRDAELLFETIVKNAFPTFTFRRLELIRVQQDTPYLEGRSWNHGHVRRLRRRDRFRQHDGSCRHRYFWCQRLCQGFIKMM